MEDANTDIEVTQAQPKRRYAMRAAQIGGVPDVYVVPLVPVRISDGAEITINRHGLHAGFTVRDTARLSFSAIPVPQFGFKAAQVVVQYDELGDADDPETSCGFAMRYMSKSGRTHEQRTNELTIDGKTLFRFTIPANHLSTNSVLPICLDVILTSSEEGRPAPVLIRGIWIEFPE